MRAIPALAFRMSLVVLTLSFSDGAMAATPQTPGADATERCAALAKVDLSQLPDAVTRILQTHLEERSDQAPAYCEVGGYIAPSIGFRMRLPSAGWNGKLIELGCGGTCGTTSHVSGCNDRLRRGYACIVSDGGNLSGGEDLGTDVKFAYNHPEAVIDLSVRSSHVTALAGKAIAERFYERPPAKSYFMGCSLGGWQAVSEAQRFPWDFDGIIAGGPNLSFSEDAMSEVWGNRALMSERGDPVLSQRDLETLHKAVVAKCDLNDGVKDGLLGDPRQCRFRPEELACATHPTEGCFSSTQIDAVRKIRAGPMTPAGLPIMPTHVFMGSELSWLGAFGGSEQAPAGDYAYMQDWFRYYLFQPNPGPSWSIRNFDFEHDYRRFGIAEMAEAVNPDLRRMKSRNGKLLMYTGWNDLASGVGRTVDYYESAEKLMGGRAQTQDFFRLFVVPGMAHCWGGEGAWKIDYLSALEAWVEQGHPPEKLIGSHIQLEDVMERAKKGDPEAQHTLARRFQFPSDPASVEFSRPVYPYPTQAKYLGHGDPKDAINFGPTNP